MQKEQKTNNIKGALACQIFVLHICLILCLIKFFDKGSELILQQMQIKCNLVVQLENCIQICRSTLHCKSIAYLKFIWRKPKGFKIQTQMSHTFFTFPSNKFYDHYFHFICIQVLLYFQTPHTSLYDATRHGPARPGIIVAFEHLIN